MGTLDFFAWRNLQKLVTS